MNFYTSDHHFGHDKILELDKRPFATLEEMHEALIIHYNSRVGDDDLVYFLGDFCFKEKLGIEVMRRLNGRKQLIRGNHDRMSATKFRNMGFEEVHKKQTM